MFSTLYSSSFSTRKTELLWEQLTPSSFSELIVSWNALRPKQGSYRFWISVKREASWSEWLPYAEWKKKGQRTFSAENGMAKSDQDVILLKEGTQANGFRIKVSCEGGATLSTFDALHACASHPPSFIIHPVPSLKAVRLPLRTHRSQMQLDHPRHRDLCSPTSVSMAIDHLLQKEKTNPIEFADAIRDEQFDIYGNWILNIAESYVRLKRRLSCCILRLNDFSALHRLLLQGLPVVVSIKGPLSGAPLPYQNGHLILVYGYNPDQKRVLCADPAFPSHAETLTSYCLDNFLTAWGRRYNLSYQFTK